MSHLYTDPATGRQYTVDPTTGQSRWVDGPPPSPPTRSFPAPYTGPGPQPQPGQGHGLRNALIVVAALIVLGVIGAAIGGGDDRTGTTTQGSAPATGTLSASASSTPAKVSSSAAKPSPGRPGIGTPVRDGKFEFTVLKVKPGVARVGGEHMGKTAQGQFVLVTVKVENIGDRSQLFAGSNQRLYDAKGRRFDADNQAAIYLGDQGRLWLQGVNPGNAVTGVVVFDVPKGATLTKIELHDSAFSGGVEVALH